MPHLNELHEKYSTKGLHIIGLYAQLQPISDVTKFVAEKKILYPQALNYDQDTYTCGSLPHVWIVGTDGKIIYSGKGTGYDKLLDEEIAKVKRPGLGRAEVVAEAEPAAKAYLDGKYAEAHKLATELANKADVSDKALADAEYILERIESRVKLLTNRADAAEVQGDYTIALRALEELATDFKGIEDAEEAPEHLAKLKADKQVPKEIEAATAFNELDRKLAGEQPTNAQWAEELSKFAATYKGTKAADRAADSASKFKAAAEEEKMKPPETTPPPEKQPEEKPPDKAPEKAPSK